MVNRSNRTYYLNGNGDKLRALVCIRAETIRAIYLTDKRISFGVSYIVVIIANRAVFLCVPDLCCGNIYYHILFYNSHKSWALLLLVECIF